LAISESELNEGLGSWLTTF